MEKDDQAQADVARAGSRSLREVEAPTRAKAVWWGAVQRDPPQWRLNLAAQGAPTTWPGP